MVSIRNRSVFHLSAGIPYQGDISYMYVQRFGFKLVIAQLHFSSEPLQPSYDPVITQLQPRQNLGDIPYTTG